MSAQPKPVEAQRRPVPDSVTLPLPLFIETLAWLLACWSMLDDFAGYCPSPAADPLLVRFISELEEAALGPVLVNENDLPEEIITWDEWWEGDPVKCAVERREDELHVAMLEAMLRYGVEHEGDIGVDGLWTTMGELCERIAELKTQMKRKQAASPTLPQAA